MVTKVKGGVLDESALSGKNMTGDIAFDTTTLKIDSSNNRVGIGTASPAAPLDVAGNFILKSPANTLYGNFDATTQAYAAFRLQAAGSSYGFIGQTSSLLASGGSNTALGLRSENELAIATGGSTERVRIDDSGNVGIGNTVASTINAANVSGNLVVGSGSGTEGITVYSGNTGLGSLCFGDGTSGTSTYTGYLTYNHSSNHMEFGAGNGLEKMRIDSSGNVGIGTNSPNAYSNVTTLTINGTNQGRVDLEYGGTLSGSFLALSGQTQIKASGGSQVMVFEVNDAERMRIDTSGNLLVGTTSTTVGAGGSGVTGFRVDSANGIVQAAASGSISAILNRTSSDGSIVSLRKDGSEIGIIGAKNGDMYMGTTDAAIRFHDSGDGIRPANASDGSALDDHLDLGAASARFNNLLLVNQPTVGSDISLKQDIEDLSDAEKRVAVKAKGLLKKYKYKNSVRDKGENARIHIGIIAQELQTAFESEGLDAYRYSMFCSDTWTDETTGEEKTQLGVRYSELLAFIIAAI